MISAGIKTTYHSTLIIIYKCFMISAGIKTT